MALTLYVGSKNYSSWSLRSYLALVATGLPFSEHVIVLDRADSRDTILAVSPAGRVPVLRHDDLLIWDSLAICEYIAELAPAARLWPADRADRARARAISAEMHSGFAALRRDMPMDMCSSRPGIGHTAEALADAARIQAIWRDCMARNHGPFLFGDFTIADAMFAPVTTRFVTYGVAMDPTARAYVDTINGLPAMRAWHAAAEREPRTR